MRDRQRDVGVGGMGEAGDGEGTDSVLPVCGALLTRMTVTAVRSSVLVVRKKGYRDTRVHDARVVERQTRPP
jgi:hypothetical protein